MGDRFGPYSHLVRMAMLFVGGTLVFLLGRSFFVPADFGVYGHYRAGALDDARAHPVAFAGQAACIGCHSKVADLRKTSRHARVSCEACHGPFATHAANQQNAATEARSPANTQTSPPTQVVGDRLPSSIRPDGLKVCVGCHVKSPSKPQGFPQIDVADHAGDNRCVECHDPHAPKIS